jgi:hypothetical protein
LQAAVEAVESGKVNASQLVDSIHLGHHPYYWGGGGAGLARAPFDTAALNPVLQIGAVNTETNAKQQAQNRAMMEAGDINDWFNSGDIAHRLHLRTASFCMAQGDNSDNAGFDQGMANFYPNTTFLQAPGHVHAMISSSWQPNAIRTTVNAAADQSMGVLPDLWGSHWNNTVSASAAVSDDGKMVVVRVHSNSSTLVTVELDFTGGSTISQAMRGAVLAVPEGSDFMTTVNTAATPRLIAPRNVTVSVVEGSGSKRAQVTIPAHSFVTATILLK